MEKINFNFDYFSNNEKLNNIGFNQSINMNNQIPATNNLNIPNLPINIFGNQELPVTSDINKDSIIKANEDGVVTTLVEDNNSYLTSYEPILNELNKLNIETKEMMGLLNQDITTVRNSNSKNKYNNIAQLSSSLTALTSSRLSIIKEASSIINNAHNMDLKRFDKVSNGADAKLNEEGIIMDLYQMISDNRNNSNIVTTSSMMQMQNNLPDPDSEYIMGIQSDFINNMNATNSEVVVVYNEADDSMDFTAIDMNGNFTNSNPNIPEKHYLSNIVIDRVNMVAKDKHLGLNYKLIILNSSDTDEEISAEQIF